MLLTWITKQNDDEKNEFLVVDVQFDQFAHQTASHSTEKQRRAVEKTANGTFCRFEAIVDSLDKMARHDVFPVWSYQFITFFFYGPQ